MTVSHDTIPAQVSNGITTARRVIETKVVPYAVPTSQKAAKQVKQVVHDKIAPMASAAVDNAMVVSQPARREALRRSKLAASALRGDDSGIAVRAKRRWPVAILFLLLGGTAGAIATWFSQAGKPIQLSSNPLPTDRLGADGLGSVDLTDETPAPHSV